MKSELPATGSTRYNFDIQIRTIVRPKHHQADSDGPMNSAHRHPRMRGIRSLLLLAGAVALSVPAGLVLPASATAAIPAGATILPGVQVGGIDLSGLDEAGARQVLSQAFASLGNGTITVAAGPETTSISYAIINRRLDVDTAIEEAFSIGRNGNGFERLMQFVSTVTTGTLLEPVVIFDEDALATRAQEIATSAGIAPVNARAIRTKLGFDALPATIGATFDATAGLPPLIETLQKADAPSALTLSLNRTDIAPSITDAEARTARTRATAMDLQIVLANSGQLWTIPRNVVHSWLSFKVVNGDALEIVFSEALIVKALRALEPKINRDPVSASWAFDTDGVEVVPARDGRALDIPRTTRRIQLFLAGRAAGTIAAGKKLGPTLVPAAPDLTTAEAEEQAAKFELLGTWTTNFDVAAHNGYGANIWVPAGYLDNQVVQPGETFSFWDRLGEVSLARGYKMGGAIVNGQTREGVALAGGICSTSTTLFNAALRAGFKIGERSNHYYFITRYPTGLDATVSKTSYGQQDMTWTNDTPYPVLIKSFKTNKSVTFSLFGIPTGRTVELTKPIIKNYKPATREVVPVSTLPTGRLVRIEYPDDGFDAWVTRIVRDSSGAVIDTRTFYSHYNMVRGIQYIGDPDGKPLVVPSYAPGAQGG